MSTDQASEEVKQKVIGVIGGAKDSILSAWQKMVKLTSKSDFLAVLEPSEKDTSILVMPRVSALAFLGEKGCQLEHESMQMLQNPAVGLGQESTAIWIVVLLDGRPHITKMAYQPMSAGGSA